MRKQNMTWRSNQVTAPPDGTGGQRAPVVVRVAEGLYGGAAGISPRLRHGAV